MPAFVVLLTSICFAASASASGVTHAAKPIHVQETFPVVPQTFEELFTTADDVVDVEIVSSTVRAVGAPANPFVRTFYTARILRHYKGSPEGLIVFTQAAGEIEYPDYILRAPDEPLKIGGRYVVFLRRNEVFGGRMLVGERSGAFEIRKGRIEPQGSGPFAEQQGKLSESSFTDELERLSRRRDLQ
jgi:hypothetical protein